MRDLPSRAASRRRRCAARVGAPFLVGIVVGSLVAAALIVRAIVTRGPGTATFVVPESPAYRDPRPARPPEPQKEPSAKEPWEPLPPEPRVTPQPQPEPVPVPVPKPEPVPRTLAELHAALKARNPEYTGKATAELEDGQFTSVVLKGCRVRDLSPLKGLPLRFLNCPDNEIADLSPLKGLPLMSLYFDGNQVADLSPLKGMPLLYLSLSRNLVGDLAPLAGMRLQYLACSENRIHDLAPLKGMPLKTLLCGGNPIADLAPLAGMTVRYLDCSNTQVADLSTLRGMPLDMVGLTGLSLRDLTPVRDTPIHTITLSPDKLGEAVEALRGHKTLRFIGVDCTFEQAKTPAYNFWLERDARQGGHRAIAILEGHKGAIASVAVSPDGGRIASASADGAIRLWDAATGQCLYTLQGHAGGALALAFSPDGKRLVSGGADGALKLWDPATGQCLKTADAQSGPVEAVAVAPDGKLIVSAGREVKAWDATALQPLRAMDGAEGGAKALAFSPDGARLACAGPRLGLWDPQTGQRVLAFIGNPNSLSFVAFSADGKRVLAGGRFIHVWKADSPDPVSQIQGQGDQYACLALSPDGHRFAAGTRQGTIELWTEAPIMFLERLTAHAGGVGALAFSPDGLRLVSGGPDGTVKLWASGPPDPIELALQDAAWRQKLDEALKMKVTLDFVQRPPGVVFALVGSTVGVAIILDPKALGQDDERMTAQVKDVPLRALLDQFLKARGLADAALDGALLITTPERAKALPGWPADVEALQQPPKADARARIALMKRVNADFAETPLEDALRVLGGAGGFAIVPEPQDVAREAKLTLKASEMRLDHALRWVCRLNGLTFLWRDGKVVVTTPELARKALVPKQ